MTIWRLPITNSAHIQALMISSFQILQRICEKHNYHPLPLPPMKDCLKGSTVLPSLLYCLLYRSHCYKMHCTSEYYDTFPTEAHGREHTVVRNLRGLATSAINPLQDAGLHPKSRNSGNMYSMEITCTNPKTLYRCAPNDMVVEFEDF